MARENKYIKFETERKEKGILLKLNLHRQILQKSQLEFSKLTYSIHMCEKKHFFILN